MQKIVLNCMLTVCFYKLWTMILKTSYILKNFSYQCGSMKPANFFISIFSKNCWNKGCLGYLLFIFLFASFTHHLQHLLPIGIAYPWFSALPTVSALSSQSQYHYLYNYCCCSFCSYLHSKRKHRRPTSAYYIIS